MILTPIASQDLPSVLQLLDDQLGAGTARAVYRRIARPKQAARAAGSEAARHHREALALAAGAGIEVRPGRPSLDFSWNGASLRGDTEAYVLLHEVAHFQLAAPERRRRIDFGLGPGPETGDIGLGVAEREEAMASLLGILWEAELGHPALASFLDQNWLEGPQRPGTAGHFRAILAALEQAGFVTPDGRPTLRLRATPDLT
jgi:hypothetical protein